MMADEPTIEEAVERITLDASYRHRVMEPDGESLGPWLVRIREADLRTLLASHASLEERVKEAKRLMQPFADEAAERDEMGDTRPVIGTDSPITVAHLRALAAFVNEKET